MVRIQSKIMEIMLVMKWTLDSCKHIMGKGLFNVNGQEMERRRIGTILHHLLNFFGNDVNIG